MLAAWLSGFSHLTLGDHLFHKRLCISYPDRLPDLWSHERTREKQQNRQVFVSDKILMSDQYNWPMGFKHDIGLRRNQPSAEDYRANKMMTNVLLCIASPEVNDIYFWRQFILLDLYGWIIYRALRASDPTIRLQAGTSRVRVFTARTARMRWVRDKS